MTLFKYINCERLINGARGYIYSIIPRFKGSLSFSKLQEISRDFAMDSSSLRPLVLCGPSGSGKSSILSKLLEEHPHKFGFSVSHTTRKPRSGEVNGVHYHFTERDVIQEAIDNGEFLENAVYSGNVYGTSKTAVFKVLEEGKVCILDIDMQGAQQVKETDLDPLMVFIQPPSLEVLEKRLRSRGTETEESLAQRLEAAKMEMDYGLTPNNFHHIIINDDLDTAYEELVSLLFNIFKFLEDAE